MHKIENMIVFGGTHGNEFTGVEVIKLLEKRNYLWRCGLKVEDGMTPRDKEIEDLKKAVYYINRKINNLEK